MPDSEEIDSCLSQQCAFACILGSTTGKQLFPLPQQCAFACILGNTTGKQYVVYSRSSPFSSSSSSPVPDSEERDSFLSLPAVCLCMYSRQHYWEGSDSFPSPAVCLYLYSRQHYWETVRRLLISSARL